jgi:hypothetical protein
MRGCNWKRKKMIRSYPARGRILKELTTLSFSISRARRRVTPLLSLITVNHAAATYPIPLPSLPRDLEHCPSLIQSTLTLCQSEGDKATKIGLRRWSMRRRGDNFERRTNNSAHCSAFSHTGTEAIRMSDIPIT